jgi:RNA polymerase sigma factor (sigma-70 family)
MRVDPANLLKRFNDYRMKKKKHLSEEDLISLLRHKNNQTQSFSILYEMYGGTLLDIIYRIIPNHSEAEDILQECMIKIWTAGQTYDSTKGRLFTWMLNIARNQAIDRYRSKDYRKQKVMDELTNSVQAIDCQKSQNQSIDVIGIRNLTENLRAPLLEVLDMVYFKGLTHVEAAEVLHLPLGTVKTRLRSAINELKKKCEIN